MQNSEDLRFPEKLCIQEMSGCVFTWSHRFMHSFKWIFKICHSCYIL